MLRKVVLAIWLFAALLIPFIGTAHAAKGGKKAPDVSGASIAVHEAAPYTLGETITFDVTVPDINPAYPYISVWCYQGDALVFSDGLTPDGWTKLGGDWSPWLEAGGPASCRADLQAMDWPGGQQTVVYLASTTFDVGG